MFRPDVRSKHEIEDVDSPGRRASRLSANGATIDILDFVFRSGAGHHGRVTDRAVAVAFRDDQVLVIRRHRDGRDYCVLPGGGVEDGEQPRAAVVRELREETGLAGSVDRDLWILEHQDRAAHYFLITVEPGPMTLGGPEVEKRSTQNRYTPEWIPLADMDVENVQPAEVRGFIRDLERTSPTSDG